MRKVPLKVQKRQARRCHTRTAHCGSQPLVEKTNRRYPVALVLLELMSSSPKQRQMTAGNVCVTCKYEFDEGEEGWLYKFKAQQVLPNGKVGQFLRGSLGFYGLSTCHDCLPPEPGTTVWAIRWPTNAEPGAFVAIEGSLPIA